MDTRSLALADPPTAYRRVVHDLVLHRHPEPTHHLALWDALAQARAREQDGAA